MKIVLHSHAFWPSLGGIESVSHSLALGFTERGHTVTVVTETPSTSERDTPYRVARGPSRRDASALIRDADIVHSNGSSMRFVALAFRHRKPFVWTHGGYQLVTLDGMGWDEGAPAPMKPLSSVLHHAKRYGIVRAGVGAAKLVLRRQVARHIAANVAVSHHLAARQPVRGQVTIYNPVEIGGFRAARAQEALSENRSALFGFVGRLVTEKGVDDLLHAFADVRARARQSGGALDPTLKVIGDGPERARLEALARELGVAGAVMWVGSKSGPELAHEVASARIFVVPTAVEETMGVVALELMAAGKPLIVSKHGGVSEVAGGAAWTFPNRDRAKLADAMWGLARDEAAQRELVGVGVRRVEGFKPGESIDAYLALFERVIAERAGLRPA